MEGSTGDLRNNLMKLLREGRRMKLQIEPNVQGLSLGSPSSFLPLLHAALMHYSLPLANWLTKHNYDLYSKSDLRFLQELYRVLRDVFHYKPKLTKEQFLSSGYAERKILFTTHVLLFCQAKHSELVSGRPKSKRTISHTSNHGNKRCTNMHTVPEKPVSSSHMSSEDRSSAVLAIHSLPHVSASVPCTNMATVETPHPLFGATPLSPDHAHICSTPPELVSPTTELGLTTHSSPHPVILRHNPPQIEPTSMSPVAKRDGALDNWHVLTETETSGEDYQDESSHDKRGETEFSHGKRGETEYSHDKRGETELGDVSTRIQELTKVVERMSAKLVLLETHVKLVDSQRGEERGSETPSCGVERERESSGIHVHHKEDRNSGHTLKRTEGGQSSTTPQSRADSKGEDGTRSTTKKQASRFEATNSHTDNFTRHTPSSRHVKELLFTPRIPSVYATPTSTDTRQLIESLRTRAKKTKEFLQLVNSRSLDTTHTSGKNISITQEQTVSNI